MDRTPNICAGPFGVLYDLYIERPYLARPIGRVVWGIDASLLYTSMGAISSAANATILDVPCGGGVAFRALRPEQNVRYIAADVCVKMLRRAERRAVKRSLSQIEFRVAEMTDLPIGDAEVDLLLSYSGLHMVDDPEQAVLEIARCLKPGGHLVGTTFLSDASRRARTLFAIGNRRGHPLPPSRESLSRWLIGAGLAEPAIGPQLGFTTFSARKRLTFRDASDGY